MPVAIPSFSVGRPPDPYTQDAGINSGFRNFIAGARVAQDAEQFDAIQQLRVADALSKPGYAMSGEGQVIFDPNKFQVDMAKLNKMNTDFEIAKNDAMFPQKQREALSTKALGGALEGDTGYSFANQEPINIDTERFAIPKQLAAPFQIPTAGGDVRVRPEVIASAAESGRELATGKTLSEIQKNLNTGIKSNPEIIKNMATGEKKQVFLREGDTIPEGWELTKAPQNPDKPSTLRKEIGDDDIIKSYRETNRQIGRLDKAMAEARSGKADTLVAVDQALITVFNKMLDPSSVVRESEYARTPADQALLSRIKGKWEKIQSGGAGLTDIEREAIYRMAKAFHDAQKVSAKELTDQYKTISIKSGYDPKLIIPADLEAAVSGQSTTETPDGTTTTDEWEVIE